MVFHNRKVEEFNIKQITPVDWFNNPNNSSVWLSGYKMFRLTIQDFVLGPKILDLDNARIIMTYGRISYLDSASATPQSTNDGKFKINTSDLEKVTPEGPYLIIILPFDKDGVQGNERITQDRIKDIVGLLIAFNDQNMAFERLFDYVINLDGKEKSVIGEVITVPTGMPKPNLSNEQLLRIQNADQKIDSLDLPTQHRIRLSLRWFEAARHDDDIDAFLKCWIAIETIAMPDTTNIKPINDLLSQIYDFSNEAVGETFHIGRLFNARGRIVHGGEQFRVSIYLILFMQAIYIDVLFKVLGLQSEKRALALIQNNEFDLKKILLNI